MSTTVMLALVGGLVVNGVVPKTIHYDTLPTNACEFRATIYKHYSPDWDYWCEPINGRQLPNNTAIFTTDQQ